MSLWHESADSDQGNRWMREVVDCEDTSYHEIWSPLVYNTMIDPREQHNIIGDAGQ